MIFFVFRIVLEAGYFLQDRAFFDNIGTILLYAVVVCTLNKCFWTVQLVFFIWKFDFQTSLIEQSILGTFDTQMKTAFIVCRLLHTGPPLVGKRTQPLLYSCYAAHYKTFWEGWTWIKQCFWMMDDLSRLDFLCCFICREQFLIHLQ